MVSYYATQPAVLPCSHRHPASPRLLPFLRAGDQVVDFSCGENYFIPHIKQLCKQCAACSLLPCCRLRVHAACCIVTEGVRLGADVAACLSAKLCRCTSKPPRCRRSPPQSLPACRDQVTITGRAYDIIMAKDSTDFVLKSWFDAHPRTEGLALPHRLVIGLNPVGGVAGCGGAGAGQLDLPGG